ncbi:MAG: 16S rRNA (cytosine(1402)-N(4))-methyltransferase RsmH [Candidatus Izemoplasmatales bacterium]|nr:16S rRNA (cytosine(1402)-N(4))-methyltransferase RsmH [Candidatus Izemoplasmatales bacterium]
MLEHVPVLLKEAIEYLNIKPDGIYVDATLGGGGHSEAILNKLTTGRLLAFDQDEYALSHAKERLASYHNVTFINANFVHLKAKLLEIGINTVDGILYDLGVSSFQFDLPERGFSYNYDSSLDMRMDQNSPLSAYDIINTYDVDQIAQILYRYGEEANGRLIARAIVKARAVTPISTTFELVDVIKKCLPNKVLSKKGHPAKQTFQALRIAVNDELHVLESSLYQAIDLIAIKGRIVVITFHSLEDRICKNIFKEKSTIDIPKGLPIISTEKPLLSLVNRHVIIPSETEIITNNRAHSAKMRVCEKNPI